MSAVAQPMHNAAPPWDLSEGQVAHLAQELVAYHRQFRGLFYRKEQRRWALKYLQGLLLPNANKCKTAKHCSFYYCHLAPFVCKHAGGSKWVNCVRQCLQDCDAFYDCSVSARCPNEYQKQPHWCNVCIGDCHAICFTHCTGNPDKPPTFPKLPARPPGSR